MQIAFTIPDQLKKRLYAHQDRSGTKIGECIRIALDEWLEKQEIRYAAKAEPK